MSLRFSPKAPGAGAILAALLLASACGGGAARWVEKRYPEGFSLKQTEDWQAGVVDKAFILVSPPEGTKDPAFLLVCPFFLKEPSSAAAWAGQHLEHLSSFFAKAAFEKSRQVRTRPDEWAARFRFERGGLPFVGLALCSVFERSGVLYVAASPAETFEKNRGRLLAMMESFRFRRPKAGEGAPMPGRAIRYEMWQDPVEQAFSLDVPRGWQIQGGTCRRAAVDFVQVLRAVSPDGKICVQFNDADLPAYTIPSPILALTGFSEGSWYSPGYGVRLLVKRHLPGSEFLQEYLERNYARRLDEFEIVRRRDRPDIVADFNEIYRRFQAYGISFTLHAGEAAFRFRRDGEPFHGDGLALTQVVATPAAQGGTWNVVLLLVTTGPDSDAGTVRDVATHMFLSVRMNPWWVAAQQRLTGAVSRIVTQTSREVSRLINESYWYRQGIMDDLSRKWSNAILGVTDVVDPETGQTWKAEAGHNYYWGKSTEYIVVGTETDTRPEIDFKPLREF